MAPAELEMYHQIKNVIGVNPSFYEVSRCSAELCLREMKLTEREIRDSQYLLMVDADTTVDAYGLNYLVAGFVEDRKSERNSPYCSAPILS